MPESKELLPTELQDLNPEDLMMGRALPPGLLVDLFRISSLTTEQIEFVSEVVSGQDQLVSPEEIEKSISSKLDKDLARSVTRAMLSFDAENVARILQVLNKLREAKPKAAEAFDNEVMTKLKDNLNKLVKKRPSFELIRKSQRLLRAIGNEIESAIFICDLRPVFDEAHKNVEGLVSIANLKIDYKDQNSDENYIEFAVSEGDLKYLMERCEDAKKKMDVLKRDYLQTTKIAETGVSDE